MRWMTSLLALAFVFPLLGIPSTRAEEKVRRLLRNPRPPASEVVSLAERLRGDPAALLGHVAREIRHEPYRGVLRGARGTLLAGAGNAADMALLLRELLKSSNPRVSTRFAFAALPEDKASRILASARASRERSGGDSGAPPLEAKDFERILREKKLEDSAPLLERVLNLARSEFEELRARADWLEGAFAQRGLILKPLERAQAESLKAAREHVWLQYLSGSDWIDLDPTLEDPAPRKRHGDPERVETEIPDEEYHRLEINVRLESLKEGRLESRYLLKTEARAADMVGTSITYIHPERLGLESLLPRKPPKDPGKLHVTPSLIVQGEPIAGDSFTLPLSAVGDGDVEASGEVVGRRLEGFLRPGARAKAKEPAEARSADDVAGLWLELVVLGKGQDREAYERPVFDRLGYVARARGVGPGAKLALARPMYAQDDPLSAIWTISSWVGETRLGDTAPQEMEARKADKDLEEVLLAFESLGVFQRSYYALCEALLDVLCGGRHSFAPAGLNLSVLACTVEPDGEAEKASFAFDLVRSRAETLGPRASPSKLSDGVIWGTAAHHAERLLLLLARVEEPVASLGADVGSVFQEARAAGIPLLLLEPEEGDRAASIVATEEARARLADRLREGFTALVPEWAPSVNGVKAIGWWLADARSGRVLDELENGGRRAEENALVTSGTRKKTEAAKQAFLPRLWKGVKKVAKTVGCALILGGPAVGAVSDGRITAAEIETVADAAQGVVDCKRRKGPEGG